MSDTATPILSVNNIEVIYDHVILVLKGVSLAVPEGGIVALLGANGAGKTTTLKAVSNLLRAERGDVTRARSSSAASASTGSRPTSSCARASSRSWRAATSSATCRSRRTC